MLYVLSLLMLVGLLILLGAMFPQRAGADLLQPGLVYSVALGTVIGAAVIMTFRNRLPQALRDLTIWTGIFFLVVLGYSFRGELQSVAARVGGELNPSAGMIQGESVVIAADGRGHFAVDAEVNGATIGFLVDTGASLVVLTVEDARRAGLDPDGLAYMARFETAAGPALGALVRLREVRLGPIVMRDVPGAVMREGLGQSLLGMSFLKRLDGYSVSDGRLTLNGPP